MARAHRALAVTLVLGLIVRALIAWGAADAPARVVDEQHYLEIARHLASGEGFAGPYGPTSIRPPLFPMFVAAIWTITGSESLAAIRVAQAALSLLNVLLLYVLALPLIGRRGATIAAAGLCFYPSLLFFNALALTETLFTLLLTATIGAYAALLRRPHPARAAAAGLALGLAVLTRSVLWPFIGILAPLVYATAGGSRTRRVALAGCVVAGYVAVVAPWSVRNTRLQGTFTMVDTMGGLNLRMGNYEHTPMDRMWDAITLDGDRHWAAALRRSHPDAATWTEGRKEKWAQAQAFVYMRTHPGLTIQRAAVKFSDFWGLERELAAGLRDHVYELPRALSLVALPLVVVSYAAIALLAAFGMFVAPPADRRVHTLMLLVVVAIAGVHTIVFGHSRYHVPLVPLLLVYAASALCSEPRRWLERPARLAAAVSVAALLVAIWAREIVIVDRHRLLDLLQVLA